MIEWKLINLDSHTRNVNIAFTELLENDTFWMPIAMILDLERWLLVTLCVHRQHARISYWRSISFDNGGLYWWTVEYCIWTKGNRQPVFNLPTPNFKTHTLSPPYPSYSARPLFAVDFLITKQHFSILGTEYAANAYELKCKNKKPAS